MREAVNDVIEQRAHDPRGLQRTMTASFVIHVGLVVLFGVVLRGWLAATHTLPQMMTMSLGVSPGPRSTGMTAIGGRPVDRIDRTKAREPIGFAPPTREVAISVPPKTKPRPSPHAESAPATSSSNPTSGLELRSGTSLVETGARGEGVGLAFGGGAGAPKLDLGVDFCCPVYAQGVIDIISRDWRRVQREKGQTIVTFTIERDGEVHGTTIERSSGSFVLDQVSRSAIPAKLPSLPPEYKDSRLVVHLTFPYGGS